VVWIVRVTGALWLSQSINLVELACSMFLISDAVCLGACIWGTYITVHKVPRKPEALHVATSAPLSTPRILANLT